MKAILSHRLVLLPCLVLLICGVSLTLAGAQNKRAATNKKNADHHAQHHQHVSFDLRSKQDGAWSDPKTWQPARVPRQNDRVLVSRQTNVVYDVQSKDVIRLVQVVGKLQFARDRNTLLNVGILKVQNSDECSESGFACDFAGVNVAGEPQGPRDGAPPTLQVGTPQEPLPAQFTARIRLHYLKGMNKDDAPALVCCSARMQLHGAPLSHTWVKLGNDVEPGDERVVLRHAVTGWRVGDEVIVTGSKRKQRSGGTFRGDAAGQATEKRRITKIEGQTLHLDKPLDNEHFGSGEFRSEVANLSRNVIIESANPGGVRGHTLYHRFSQGGISYARFAHLGKENVLGRYAIHYHLVGDTMRGSGVIGASIVDSHNRWITIHGTEYLVVRDCVGYQSVGHGYFLEDGTEVFNLLDRNLAVQAYEGRRLPKQVLPFDPNDGAGFWWANGRNTLTRNVTCENDQYGYRYDSQKRSNFDSNLSIRMPSGDYQVTDIRTVPISRFSDNESHTEGLYSIAVAGTDGAGPDTRHPHRLANLKIWHTHYALRSQLPTMLVENVKIHHAAYGIYRPWFENHVYRNLHIARTGAEPFNRGLDDRSLQHGSITVDGLTFSDLGYGGQMPLIQISANNVTGEAESHFRRVQVLDRQRDDRWPLINLGGGPRLKPSTPKGVPYFVHDYYGKGQHAKVVSTRASDLVKDGNKYQKDPPLTGNESVAAMVEGIEFPQLLDPVDDLAPATVILQTSRQKDKIVVSGVAHDDGQIKSVVVNGRQATIKPVTEGVVDWRIEIDPPSNQIVMAHAVDRAGNAERTPHQMRLGQTESVKNRQAAAR